MQERKNAGTQTDASRTAGPRIPAFLRFCVPALLCLTVAACAHGRVSAVDLPPLAVPSPPPRVVEVSEPVQSPIVALPEDPHTDIRPSPTPSPRTGAPRAAEQPKVEPPPVEPLKPPDEAPRPPQTTLQTTPTQREGEVERRVRSQIAQASYDLGRVNYQALNADARIQYETAKRFASQAEEALRSRNLVFASNLADKAAALAAQLLGR
jgi:hypothetical protein